tara:strand:+ start:154 stop:312 length:159 start_codon:yes stop_codon:yes gene_type:complete
MKWSVYDVAADDIIGVWNSYEDAEMFWLDHQHLTNINWQLFPCDEIYSHATI